MMHRAIACFLLILATTSAPPAYSSQADADQAEKLEVVSNYEAAIADGDQAAAVKYVMDYTAKTEGENAPATVKLTASPSGSLALAK